MNYLPVFCNSFPSGRACRMRGLLLVFLIFIFAGSSAFASKAQKNESKLQAPDVLILVLTNIGALDQVSINYNSNIPIAVAQKDLNFLIHQAKWLVQNPNASIEAPNIPGAKPTTSVLFTTQGMVNTRTGAMALEPFIEALKRFKHIEIDYIQVPNIQYRGVKDFENDFVKINLSQSGSVYRYKVVIKDSKFNNLQLPVTQAQTERVGHGGMPVGARIMLIIGIALLGAMVVYVATTIAVKRSKA